MTTAPVEDIVNLYQAGSWWKEQPESRAAIPRMIRGSFCFMLVKNAVGENIGMGRVISDGASDAYIQDLVLLPEYRGRGLGKELVRRLLAFCRERGVDWVALIAEAGTKEFYEGLGFVAVADFQFMLHRES